MVARAQAGDLEAFEVLYRANLGRVYALCYRMAGDASLAEELAQDVFVRAWQRLGSFRGESAFSSWLHPLTVNVALSERRSRRRRTSRVMSTDDPAAFERPETPKTGPEAAVDIDRALETLPPGARSVFVLHDVEGYKHDEIAQMTGVATGTSKAQLAPGATAAQGGTGPMTCEQIRDRLDEYVDGDLAEAEFQEVELHLGGCPECRQEERELRALIARAAALSEEMWPAQDLWPDIAARLRGPEGMRLVPRTGLARWMGPMSIAAAAAVVVALSAALWTRGNIPGVAPAAPQGSVRPVAMASSVLLDSERDYARATADLMAAIEAQKETLAPETRAVLDANLQDDRRRPGPGAGGAGQGSRQQPARAPAHVDAPEEGRRAQACRPPESDLRR